VIHIALDVAVEDLGFVGLYAEHPGSVP